MAKIYINIYIYTFPQRGGGGQPRRGLPGSRDWGGEAELLPPTEKNIYNNKRYKYYIWRCIRHFFSAPQISSLRSKSSFSAFLFHKNCFFLYRINIYIFIPTLRLDRTVKPSTDIFTPTSTVSRCRG